MAYSFFEIRYEDQTKNKKYFYSYYGEGLRYELQEFLSMIVNDRRSCYKLRRRESVAIADVIGQYNNHLNVVEICSRNWRNIRHGSWCC